MGAKDVEKIRDLNSDTQNQKIRNSNVEIRNKPNNLNPNYEIQQPFVWILCFLVA